MSRKDEIFQSTRPTWGATGAFDNSDGFFEFQSTRPTWGATQRLNINRPPDVFQSTRPTWGATIGDQADKVVRAISIHAPHVGRDSSASAEKPCQSHFNPRAPRGARLPRSTSSSHGRKFQSTRPTWGATSNATHRPGCAMISIHAPHVGRDKTEPKTNTKTEPFQSTRPTWGATLEAFILAVESDISIHAPHVGRDGAAGGPAGPLQSFQSTRPTWGATRHPDIRAVYPRISIHAPHVGRDGFPSASPPVDGHFNPRAPRGARQITSAATVWLTDFNPRAPRGARRAVNVPCPTSSNFNPRAPRGARRGIFELGGYTYRFQSTRPTWGATSPGH